MLNSDQTPTDGRTREFLAITVTLSSLGGVILLATVIVLKNQTDGPAKDVLTIVLPLIGTWVGTVLAFFFSKENFEAATRSVSDLAKQVSPQQKLQSISVRGKMIPRENMFVVTMPIDETKIADLLAVLEKENKGDRIPVLTDKSAPKYIIHRSMLDKFVADKAKSSAGQNVSEVTIGDLFREQPDLERLFATSFATIKPDATLADAKTSMEQTKNCEDVFVTMAGTTNDEVVGWITDNIIQANLQA